MAKDLNGWTKWILGILATIMLTAFTTLTTNVIANDTASRDRDAKMMEQVNDGIKEQLLMNQQILICLAELKQQVKANGNHS